MGVRGEGSPCTLLRETRLGPGSCALLRKASWCPGKDTGPKVPKLHLSSFPSWEAMSKSFYIFERPFLQQYSRHNDPYLIRGLLDLLK